MDGDITGEQYNSQQCYDGRSWWESGNFEPVFADTLRWEMGALEIWGGVDGGRALMMRLAAASPYISRMVAFEIHARKYQ